MQPPGRCSLSTHYGLRPEREGLHLVLQVTVILRCTSSAPNNNMADSLMDDISRFVEESTEAEILEESREVR